MEIAEKEQELYNLWRQNDEDSEQKSSFEAMENSLKQ